MDPLSPVDVTIEYPLLWNKKSVWGTIQPLWLHSVWIFLKEILNKINCKI